MAAQTLDKPTAEDWANYSKPFAVFMEPPANAGEASERLLPLAEGLSPFAALFAMAFALQREIEPRRLAREKREAAEAALSMEQK